MTSIHQQISDNGSAVCPFCKEVKITQQRGCTVNINFTQSTKKNIETFYCDCYFCHKCGLFFFAVHDSTTAMKGESRNTQIDDFIQSIPA